ncbi:MAG TPA: DUF5947 family protein [Bryobacteraceae bacterium]|jgi:hypothetical protein|nr:DUF5947 family protein [Bryobacteraceae bacterium]
MKRGGQTPARGLALLRQFVNTTRPELEYCDLCATPLAEHHQHLVDLQKRRLVCACDACAILFASSGETNLRRVPRDAWMLGEFALSDQVWNSLGIPIGLAFIYNSSVGNQIVAVYPSPAGPTETSLEQESWQEITDDNPHLLNLRPDVEALLINRMNGAREYFRAPIDECYKLTGIVRKYWRGFSGGEEGWEQISGFFDHLKERCTPQIATTYARSFI